MTISFRRRIFPPVILGETERNVHDVRKCLEHAPFAATSYFFRASA
jgi:hypothetical protein